MEKIDYFDKINNEMVKVEMTEEMIELINNLDNMERRQSRRSEKNVKTVEKMRNAENIFIDEDDPLSILIRKEEDAQEETKIKQRRMVLRRAVKTLTDKEFEIIKGIFVDNKTQSEVAQKLKISRSAVNQRYDGALAKIKEFIENNEKQI